MLPEFIDPRLLADRRVFRIAMRVVMAEAALWLSWNVRVQHADWLFQAMFLALASWVGLSAGMRLMRDWLDPHSPNYLTTPVPLVYLAQIWFWNNVLALELWLFVWVPGTGIVASQFWLVTLCAVNAAHVVAALGAIAADPAWRLTPTSK